MRKNSSEAAMALVSRRPYKSKNDRVYGPDDDWHWEYHGNKIAWLDANNDLHITLSGWDTMTTRERLNCFQWVNIFRDKGKTMLNGIPWDGEWIMVPRRSYSSIDDAPLYPAQREILAKLLMVGFRPQLFNVYGIGVIANTKRGSVMTIQFGLPFSAAPEKIVYQRKLYSPESFEQKVLPKIIKQLDKE